MSTYAKPANRPVMPYFSSGPTKKRPGWSPAALEDACTGRSHRSAPAKDKIKTAMNLAREILGICLMITASALCPARIQARLRWPCGHCLARAALKLLAWESFGKDWVTDAVSQLKIDPMTRASPLMGNCLICVRSISIMMSFSHGMGLPPASKCQMATGFLITAPV